MYVLCIHNRCYLCVVDVARRFRPIGKKNNKNVQCPRRQPPPPTDGNEPLDVNNCSTSV